MKLKKEIRQIAVADNACLTERKFKKFFFEVFENSSGPAERFKNICRKLNFFLQPRSDNKLQKEEIDEVLFGLKKACDEEEEESFVLCGFNSLKPILNWKKRDQRSFENLLRKNQVHYLGFIELNEMLSYDKQENEVNIHLSPSESLAISEKISLLKEGFSKLARFLIVNPEIEKVVATSWIIAFNPGLIENLGFTIEGEISRKEQAALRDVLKRPISRAYMERDGFIKRHL